MYFVLNVNACIVHFSHENESLRGIQLGPVTAEAHCQGAKYSAEVSVERETPDRVLIPIIITPGAALLCLPSVWPGSAPPGSHHG